jgi:transcriptional regulator, araC family
MSSVYVDFMLKMGFKLDSSCKKFSPLGTTLSISNEFMEGYYWIYDNKDFAINIHDFKVKKDYIVQNSAQREDTPLVSISYFKTAHGETLSPYRPASDNMIFTFFEYQKVFRFFLHGGYPFFSVGIEYKKDFIENYIPKSFGIDKADLINALQLFDTFSPDNRVKSIADGILAYNNTTPLSEIFYEVKAKELLNIVVDTYFEHSRDKLSSADDTALKNICFYINDHYASDIPQKLLCEIAFMSKTSLKEKFRKKYNMSITEYIQRRRITVAEHILISADLKISEVAKAVGYTSHSRFSCLFKKYTGMFPNDFRKAGFLQ